MKTVPSLRSLVDSQQCVATRRLFSVNPQDSSISCYQFSLKCQMSKVLFGVLQCPFSASLQSSSAWDFHSRLPPVTSAQWRKNIRDTYSGELFVENSFNHHMWKIMGFLFSLTPVNFSPVRNIFDSGAETIKITNVPLIFSLLIGTAKDRTCFMFLFVGHKLVAILLFFL